MMCDEMKFIRDNFQDGYEIVDKTIITFSKETKKFIKDASKRK